MSFVLSATVSGYNIGSIVSFNMRAGRTTKSEIFQPGGASLTVRNLSSLPASLVLGASVSVTIDTYGQFGGAVTNIQYNYGIVPAMDTAVITMEGALASIGRGQLSSFTLSGGTTGYEASRIGSALTGTAKTVSSSGTRSLTNNSTTYSGAALNMFQTLVAMEQGRIQESFGSLRFYGRDITQNPTAYPYVYTGWYMTDVASDTTGVHYDNVVFGSLTDNYYTQVQITPDGMATQIAGTGDRNLTMSTYDVSTTQGADLASYMLSEFDTSTSVPVSISTTSTMVNGNFGAVMVGEAPVRWQLPITFRGATYNSIIEGYSVSATPDLVRYTFDVSGFEQNNFFVLNDPVYGVLDSNNLSF